MQPTIIDIIILSYAKNDELKNLTQQTINSLIQSESADLIEFKVMVIESAKDLYPFQFDHSTTFYPDAKFGFNRYLNFGLQHSSQNLICFCNNDLIFSKNWASEIIAAMKNNENILSASTYCPVMHGKNNFNLDLDVIEGYENLFSGWCFLVKRKLIDIIGPFDEKFDFWYADSDYLKTLQKHRIKNYLITKSVVTHLNSSTSRLFNKIDYYKYTLVPQLRFNYKWGYDNYFIYMLKRIYFTIKYYLNPLQK